MDTFKKHIIHLLEKQGLTEINLETPPNTEMGDYAYPCFNLAKEQKKSPMQIAKELSQKLATDNHVDKIEPNGPYVNFYINKTKLAEQTVHKILEEKQEYGSNKQGHEKTIVIDMSSPNIAKPFGIGHLRSTIIGNSIAKISQKNGYNPIRLNYLGDWGTQFGKLIVGYKHHGDEKKLESDPIKHLLEIYVKANEKPEYEQEARGWFKKLEDGDKDATHLWKKFKELSLEDFNKIYKILNIKFEVISGESLYNHKMGKIIEELKHKNLLEESDGAQIVNLEKYGLGVCLIQKSDGTTLYATRDITAAIDRHEKYEFSKMIYEVGAEQKLHFKQVFKVLELMGHSWAKDLVHVDHGLYLGPDGKKFATRKGKTVFMEEVIRETVELAKKTIEEKNPALKNKDEAARIVAIAAIFFGDLKNNRVRDAIFDIDKFIEFEGDTGPYIQYTYARASSILRKADKKINHKAKTDAVEEKEAKLIRQLAGYNEIIKDAYAQLSPHVVANYALTLAQSFNEFYHACQVIGSENEEFRLALVESTRIVIKDALSLLGIETLEEM